jgi:hypothetical protein
MLNVKFGALPMGSAMGSDMTLHQEAVSQPIQTMPIATKPVLQKEGLPRYTSQTTKPAPPKPPKKVKTCVALYDFVGEHPGDLSFQKGDVIYISSQNGDWYEGSCHGAKGIFPANYVS